MRRQTRHRLEALAASTVAALVRPLPRRAALALGAALGRTLGALDRRHVAIAVDNLRHAFPDWPAERLARTAHAVYAHFGRVLLDILWLHGRPREDTLPLVEVVGAEHVRAAVARGRGVVLVTGHIGNWEMHGLAHGWTFGPIAVVARPLDNPELDRRLCAFRTSGGNSVVYKQKALSTILKTLRGGGAVALLIDQNVQASDGIFVDYFGRAAATTTVAAAVALKTGAALLPCRTELLPDGRYRATYDPPLALPSTGSRTGDVAVLTQALTKRIEAWVRVQPDQWLWIHRRWKTRPAAEAAPVVPA